MLQGEMLVSHMNRSFYTVESKPYSTFTFISCSKNSKRDIFKPPYPLNSEPCTSGVITYNARNGEFFDSPILSRRNHSVLATLEKIHVKEAKDDSRNFKRFRASVLGFGDLHNHLALGNTCLSICCRRGYHWPFGGSPPAIGGQGSQKRFYEVSDRKHSAEEEKLCCPMIQFSGRWC